jgi:hypothetical protein
VGGVPGPPILGDPRSIHLGDEPQQPEVGCPHISMTAIDGFDQLVDIDLGECVHKSLD